MAHIGGNITGAIQTCAPVTNEIGETVKGWADALTVVGWLDLMSGDSKYNVHNAKVEESTHIFLCDFNAALYALADKDTRMVFKGVIYDTLLIDNPMEMNEQLEIYLRRVGAWNG